MGLGEKFRGPAWSSRWEFQVCHLVTTSYLDLEILGDVLEFVCARLWLEQMKRTDTRLITRQEWDQPERVKGLENVQVIDVAGSGVVSMALAKDGSV